MIWSRNCASWLKTSVSWGWFGLVSSARILPTMQTLVLQICGFLLRIQLSILGTNILHPSVCAKWGWRIYNEYKHTILLLCSLLFSWTLMYAHMHLAVVIMYYLFSFLWLILVLWIGFLLGQLLQINSPQWGWMTRMRCNRNFIPLHTSGSPE